MRVKGALLVLPFRVYRLTVYVVPGRKPEGEKKAPPAQNHGRSSLLWGQWSVGACSTWECVGAGVSGDAPGDSGVCATAGRGSDQVTGDGFISWTPGQCERILLEIKNAHAARGTNFCRKTEKQVFLFCFVFKKKMSR